MLFQSKIKQLRKAIAKAQNERAKIAKKEAQIKAKWYAAHQKHMDETEAYLQLKNYGTVKAARLRKNIKAWRNDTYTSTTNRDTSRERLKDLDDELTRLGLELARLSEQENSQINATDEIVTQVFALNETVVRAADDREECLKRHVFPRLIKDGKLCSQVSFLSSNGLRKVTAMVNTMTIVRGELAIEAKLEIEKFFAKFQATAMDKNTQALFELTKQILIEKTNFKVGPDLYRFLGMELDDEIFPELSLAQRYLRQSIRSEKTNSYIRIYQRRSRADKWEVVPQS